jgi:F-type H+-transporting ATPase subunit epsilon
MAESANVLALSVATPLGVALDLETESVQVPSVVGELGVLPGHVPLLAAVKPGILAYRRDGQTVRVAIGGGYAEVDFGSVRLLTEFFARTEDVDVEQARRDLDTAESRLKAHDGPIDETEHKEAQRDLDWALARLALVGGEAN